MADEATVPASEPPPEPKKPSAPGGSRFAGVGRAVGLTLGALIGIAIFARITNDFYPVKHWLFWVYAKLWGWVLLFAAASFSIGNLVMRRVRMHGVPLRERLVFTVTLGVLAFFYCVFLGGIVGVLRPWFAVSLPLVLIAAGARDLWRDGKRVYRHVKASRARGVTARSPWAWPTLAFGVLGLALIYYGLLSPRNVAFDSHFYHLGIAQQYATEHAIRPFKEGWLPGALPHLSSILYTWFLCLPGLDMFGRMVGAQHLEFVLFVFTLGSIPVLVRYLAPRADVRFSWAATFLFPCIFVYDANLSAAADHIAAFWAIPSYLAFRRAYRELGVKESALLGACLSGAILTKYQAMYILAFPVLGLIGKCAWLLAKPVVGDLRAKRKVDLRALRAPLYGLGAAFVAGLVFTSAHWLKNLVFYKNPLFPYLGGIFPANDWVPDAHQLAQDWNVWDAKSWVTEGTTSEKVLEAAKAMFTFSFAPHDWKNFHGKMPVFGSLFTLSLLLLPFLRRTKRIWALSVATHLGVFIWFYTKHQDRYLQAILPWMVVVTAATFAVAWRSGAGGKAATSLLVAFQLVWGGDAFLIPASSMTKAAAINVSNELVAMGYKKQYEQRFKVGGSLFDIGSSAELPADARVLIHENNPRLGVWRPVVADVAGWQFGIRYELFDSAALMDDKVRALGVTHIVSRAKKSREADCLGADLRFFDYLEQEARPLKRFGEMTLYALPATRPSADKRDQVAYFGCSKLYEKGLHDLAALHVREKQVQKAPPKKRAKQKGEPAALLDAADFAVTDPGCKPAVAPALLKDFVKIGKRGKLDLWSRKRSAGESPDVDDRPASDGPDKASDDPLDRPDDADPTPE